MNNIVIADRNGESSSFGLVLKYSLFFLPILLGFILTDFTLSGEVLAKRGMAKQQAQMLSSYDSGKHANGEKISVTDDNYFEVLDDLLNNLDTIEGKEIEISGFIYREDTFTKKTNGHLPPLHVLLCGRCDVIRIYGQRECGRNEDE
ncbi:hypothetical protein RCO48_24890 [Peribacillus frigoritolerans]|nr:hypothetical protein [Peribacillus frigoritolerans]